MEEIIAYKAKSGKIYETVEAATLDDKKHELVRLINVEIALDDKIDIDEVGPNCGKFLDQIVQAGKLAGEIKELNKKIINGK